MATDYQERLMKMGNVSFEEIKDSDILTFEQWEQGFGPRCIFYLYDKKGNLKDVQCGKDVPISERKMLNPNLKNIFPKKQKLQKINND